MKQFMGAAILAAALFTPVFLPAALYGDEATYVSLEMLLEKLYTRPDIAQSQAALSAAVSEAEKAAYRGNIDLQVSPSFRSSWLPGDDAGIYHELSASLSASIPLGLSDDEHRRLDRALLKVRTAELDMKQSIMQTAGSLYRLYSAAYSAADEIPVLQAELGAARIIREWDTARFERGEIALTDVFKAEEDERRAQNALNAGLMKTETALAELMTKAGIPISRDGRNEMRLAGTIILEPIPGMFPSDTSQLPQLPVSSHPSILKQEETLMIFRAELEPVKPDVLSSVRLSYSEKNQSFSASWSFQKPALSLSYTPPSWSITNPLPGGTGRDSGDQSAITLAVSIALSAGSRTALAESAARAAYDGELLKMESLVRSVEKDLHTKIMEFESAVSLVPPPREAEIRAEKLLEIVLTRDSLGMAETGDTVSAEAALLRARYSAEEAGRKADLAWMSLLDAAAFPKELPNFISSHIFGGSE